MDIKAEVFCKINKSGGKIDLNTLKAGIKKNENNELIFKKFDENVNGILEQNEINTIKESVKPYIDDGVLSKREAKKILKNAEIKNSNANELYKFLTDLQIESSEIENCFNSLFGDTKAIDVRYKKDSDGNVLTSSFDMETGAKIQDLVNGNGKKQKITYGEDGTVVSKEIQKGAVTTLQNGEGNVLKQVTDKGNGLKEVVEYEYENGSKTPTKITTTKIDGTVIVQDGDGDVINSPTQEISEPEVEQTEEHKVFDNGRVLIKTENGATIQDAGKEPVNIKYDSEGNILSNAKEGESFEQTAARLGIKPGTEEFDKFKELNSKAAKKGWFVVGAEVKIPAGMEEKINLEGVYVDSKSEISKHSQKAVENADISKYNETNTEKIVLDKNTNWWNLAKESLMAEGNQKPTNADITARMNELQKLNNGKQPAKGSEITMPKSTQSTPVVEDETPDEPVEPEKPITTTEPDTPTDPTLPPDNSGITETLLSLLTRKGSEVADDLYSDIHQIGTGKDFDKHIKDIKSDNVVEVLNAYDAKSSGETLVEAIFDEIGMGKEKQIASVNHIKDALIARSKNLKVDISVLNAEFEQAFNDATSGILASAKYVNTSKLDQLISEYTKRISTMEKMDKAAQERYFSQFGATSVPDDHKERMKNLVKQLVDDSDDIYGNGKIDHPAIQVTGNCWAHAGLNSMLATPKGKEMLDNLITKKDGVISVCLPEAAKNGLPKPNGDGVYTFTEYDIGEGATSQSLGDGDVTAFMLAINKYFEETGEKSDSPDNMDGNTNYRMLEILSGKKMEIISKFTGIPDGIGATIGCKFSLYSDLTEMLSSGKGAITCSFYFGVEEKTSNATTLSRQDLKDKTEGEPYIKSGHTYAVTKMDKDFVYLVESNNPNTVIKMPKEEFKDKVKDITTYKF